MRLYHILSAKFAKSDLLRKRLRISRFHELNDPFECYPFESIHAIQSKGKEDITKVFGLLCFSSTYSDPAMWAHYGERHRGICLGFDVLEPTILKVDYSITRLSSPMGSIPTLEEWVNKTVIPFVSTKAKSWAYEKEFRLIKNLSECHQCDEYYFCPFSKTLLLREVILGYSFRGYHTRIQYLIDRIDSDISLFRMDLSKTKFEMVKVPI